MSELELVLLYMGLFTVGFTLVGALVHIGDDDRAARRIATWPIWILPWIVQRVPLVVRSIAAAIGPAFVEAGRMTLPPKAEEPPCYPDNLAPPPPPANRPLPSSRTDAGHQPARSTTNPANPPTGGSGVPPRLP